MTYVNILSLSLSFWIFFFSFLFFFGKEWKYLAVPGHKQWNVTHCIEAFISYFICSFDASYENTWNMASTNRMNRRTLNIDLFLLKEACYSRVPVGISLQIKGFPILAVLEICFIACRSSHGSNWSFGRPSKCPLWPLEPRKLSSWMKFLQYKTGCALGCSEVTKNNCNLSP